eukprot:CAMPEP_0168624258 /NCGR_PEP_ID=MMETSP0449_2-20121227/9302_1 /TAXON_ID=1082188 /ORGANISM="Strombidium rassoulzadegani, Strain ras09" /LENGTH=60 /DNA_ID=CAMNT_0008665773 /DNA_START=13 /DNA_END=191 /DNA_ORIENTATION=+
MTMAKQRMRTAIATPPHTIPVQQKPLPSPVSGSSLLSIMSSFFSSIRFSISGSAMFMASG